MIDANPIIDEIRRTRESMLAKHGGSLDLLVSELQGLSEARVQPAKSLKSPLTLKKKGRTSSMVNDNNVKR